MTDSPSPAAWIPGLPSEPCVCDVRVHVGARVDVLRNVRVSGDRWNTGLSVIAGARIPGESSAIGLVVEMAEWRPIEVPQGV